MQAVIRLSKQYLPEMAKGYENPKVKVHIGDGFKFLDDYKNEFDVIITDSSDPEGPAESLFQKPYFQLLHGALREGGVITTQGCTFICVACFSGNSRRDYILYYRLRLVIVIIAKTCHYNCAIDFLCVVFRSTHANSIRSREPMAPPLHDH